MFYICINIIRVLKIFLTVERLNGYEMRSTCDREIQTIFYFKYFNRFTELCEHFSVTEINWYLCHHPFA